MNFETVYLLVLSCIQGNKTFYIDALLMNEVEHIILDQYWVPYGNLGHFTVSKQFIGEIRNYIRTSINKLYHNNIIGRDPRGIFDIIYPKHV